jgi:hypothetical protein
MDGEVCDCIINLDPILRQAKEASEAVERKKTSFKLSSTGELAGEARGEVTISINVVPLSVALKRPVGLRRDEPNDDPFISEPARKKGGLFGGALCGMCGKFTPFIIGGIVVVLIIVIVVVVVVTMPVDPTAAAADPAAPPARRLLDSLEAFSLNANATLSGLTPTTTHSPEF